MERVYVGNLPPDIRIKDIDDFFRPFGKLINIDVNHRANPVYAYVQFDNARNAFNAVKARHGYDYEGYTLQMRLVENEVRRRRDPTPPPPPPPMLNDYRYNSNSINNRMGGNYSNTSMSSSSFQTNSNQWSGNTNHSGMHNPYVSNNPSTMASFSSGGRSNNNNSNRSNMLQQYGNNSNNLSRGNMSQDNMNYSNRNMMNYSNTNRYDMSQQQQQNMNMMGYSNNANSNNWVIGNNDSWNNNANNNSWNNGNNSWNNGNNSWNSGNNSSWNNGNNSWNSGNNSSWNNGNNSWNNGTNSWNNGNNNSWNNGNNNCRSGGNNSLGNMDWNSGNNVNLDMGNNFNSNDNSYVYNANNDPYSKFGYEDKYTAGLSGSGRKWFNRYIRKGFSPEMARAKALEHRTVPYLRKPPKNIPDPNDPTNAALETIGNTILSLLNTSGNVDNFNNVNMMPGNANWVGDDFQGPSTSNARGGRVGGANKPPGRNPISKESYFKSVHILRRHGDKRPLRQRDRIAKKFHSKIVSAYERFERAKASSAGKPSENTKTYAEMTVTLRKKKQHLLTSARRLEKDPKKRSGPEYKKRMKILINEHGFPEIEARSLAVHPMHKLKSLLALKAKCEPASSSHKSGSSLTANVTKKAPVKRNNKDRGYRNDINYLRMYETHKFSTISPRVRTALRLCLDRIHKHEKEANMPLTKTKFSKLLPKADGKKKTTGGSSSSKETPAKKTNTKKGENKDDKKSNDKKDTAKDKKSQENTEDGNESKNEGKQEEAQHDDGDNEGGQEEEFEDAENVEQGEEQQENAE